MPSFDSFGRQKLKKRRFRAASDVVGSAVMGALPDGGLLPFGNGRSYGDSCHNDAGTLADFRPMSRIIAFDAKSGMLAAEPGVMLHQIIDHVAPHGWFLPVTPGTRFVTLGGAVANDVHGKNHHKRGTFGRHVDAIDLVRGDGRYKLSPKSNATLFNATIGGMGLTGLMTRITIRLMKVGAVDVMETRTPFSSLDEYFAMADDADRDNEYAVAWLDQLNGERGVLMTANHAGDGDFVCKPHKPRVSVPFDLPFNALNSYSLQAFNELFFRAKAKGAGIARRTSWQSYFYPLDAVGHWNRLYGPKGLYQHQSVIPFETAEDAIPAMLSASKVAGEASFLTVLKRFGDIPSPGLMSFPRPGYTLTLDFANRGQSTLDLLETLDRITVEAGGSVNGYKDARMSPETFLASYPDWFELESLRDRAIMSDFWNRTAMALPEIGIASNATDLIKRIETPVS